MKQARKHIVNAWLTPEEKSQFDAVCDQRGMTIKVLLGRLIAWFAERDLTEQSIILGQLEVTDKTKLAEMLKKRK